MSRLLHGCPFRAHLQTPSPHVFLSVISHGRTFLPGAELQGIIFCQHEQGKPRADQAPNPPGKQSRSPTSITNCMQAQSNPTLAILFDSGQLWPDNQLRKLRLLVSSLQLGTPHSNPRTSGLELNNVPHILQKEDTGADPSG